MPYNSIINRGEKSKFFLSITSAPYPDTTTVSAGQFITGNYAITFKANSTGILNIDFSITAINTNSILTI